MTDNHEEDAVLLFSSLSRLIALVALPLCLAVLPGNGGRACAATAASIDASGGYAGQVLDKIIAHWDPPPALRGDFQARLKIALDAQGNVTDCKAVTPSELEALDSSLCGTVRHIGSFGPAPHDTPLDLHMAFWTGTPKGRHRPRTMTTEEAMRAEIQARTKAEAALEDTRAAAAEDRARQRAEAAAKEHGRELPDVRPAPVAPAAPPPPRTSPEKTPARKRAGVSDDNSPAVVLMGRSAPRPSTNNAPPPLTITVTDSAQEPVPSPEETSASPAPEPAPDAHAHYLTTVAQQAKKVIVIPLRAREGRYTAEVRLLVEATTGKIRKVALLRATGDKFLDRNILRDIPRMGKIAPPPAGFGEQVDITLTLVRGKSASGKRGKRTP
ncbi:MULTISPECIES: TonB C-terminal domain-containing protein [unclassified Desulfovibrio]|uniref:TonB C-terminal domain-containing protein n=1 Tax=unclassified Desulfovibrio TaxID=2593640 RepID=UPI00163AB018|nr:MULTISPECIES: TonB C-terminal domain-containing protein [unclassified Desulfovibrio]